MQSYTVTPKFFTHLFLLWAAGRICRMARSVALNWVPMRENKKRLVDAFTTINKWFNEIMATTHNGETKVKPIKLESITLQSYCMFVFSWLSDHKSWNEGITY